MVCFVIAACSRWLIRSQIGMELAHQVEEAFGASEVAAVAAEAVEMMDEGKHIKYLS